METVSIVDVKARLSELINRVERGEEIMITRRGRPISVLMPVPAPPLPLDKAFFSEVATMTVQKEDAATFIRRMRDDDRY